MKKILEHILNNDKLFKIVVLSFILVFTFYSFIQDSRVENNRTIDKSELTIKMENNDSILINKIDTLTLIISKLNYKIDNVYTIIKAETPKKYIVTHKYHTTDTLINNFKNLASK